MNVDYRQIGEYINNISKGLFDANSICNYLQNNKRIYDISQFGINSLRDALNQLASDRSPIGSGAN